MTESMFVDPIRQPYFSPVFIPTLPNLSLSEEERGIISKLQMRAWRNRYWMELTDSYYRGMQVITSLNIAIPDELTYLRTVVGWPRKAVDPVVQRSAVDCFRLHGATDGDPDLEDVWIENGMDAELPLATTDSLAMGRGWFLLGSPASKGDAPKISVESPLNISASWDVASALPKEILQSYWLDGRRHAVLYILGQTIYIGEDDDGIWQLTNRDKHGMDFIPAQRMANSPRSHDRDGASEITPELMSITDAACRTMLGLEISSEVYSVPKLLLMGASESDFQNPDGTPKSALSTYITRVLALERDEDGNLPDVKQLQPYDPSVYTKVIEMYASQAASIVRGNPQDFGLYTSGNPVSADAYNSTEADRNTWISMKHRMWGVSLVKSMQMATRFMNGGTLLPEYRRMVCDWMPPELVDFTGAADAVSKLVTAGVYSATSDVTLKKTGLNAVQRQRMEQDRLADQGEQFLAEVAHSLTAKTARVDKSLTEDIVAQPASVVPGPDANVQSAK